MAHGVIILDKTFKYNANCQVKNALGYDKYPSSEQENTKIKCCRRAGKMFTNTEISKYECNSLECEPKQKFYLSSDVEPDLQQHQASHQSSSASPNQPQTDVHVQNLSIVNPGAVILAPVTTVNLPGNQNGPGIIHIHLMMQVISTKKNPKSLDAVLCFKCHTNNF